MVDWIIGWCIAHRGVVLGLTFALTVAGAAAMAAMPVDAVPDVSDIQVIVSSEWPGRSPDLIEDQVTYPIVSALLSTPRVKAVRGFTDFGISYVYVIFEDGTDLYWARSRVVEYLQGLRATLPAGVAPTLGPDATGVGWVFEYALVDETGRLGLAELRSLQDWSIRQALASTPGVAQVASIGGFVKQYQVVLDPNRLAAYAVTPKEVVDAVRASNNDIEGRLLEFAGREYMVRARGYLTSAADIEQVSLRTSASGTPVRVGDVARVEIGPDLRRGAAELDGKGEAVGGIVIMRVGENALGVIDRVKARMAALAPSLPPGVKFIPTYDRSGLIRDSIGTLRRAILEEVVVVSIVMIVFLSQFRAALIPIVCLPIAVLVAFIPFGFLSTTANIMSLGGVALAIGVVVDASIVMVENAHRRLSSDVFDAARDRGAVIVEAARQVGRPVFFSLVIIVISFTPVFLLEAQEGRMFLPLALTKTFVMTAATGLALTLVPVLMFLLMRRDAGAAATENAVTRWCARLYEPLLRAALNRPWLSLAVNAAVLVPTIMLMASIGTEFMPSLYEGSLLYMPTAPPGLSITEATTVLQRQDQVLARFPEVERVFGTVGRADTPTDNSPMGMVNTTITLKPREAWRPGLTLEGLQASMDEALQIPGMPNVWTQPIRGRLDMLATGIKTPIGIKILGPDLAVIQELGHKVEALLRQVPDTRSVYAERVSDGRYADIRIDRAAIARYGLTVQDVEQVVQTAIGGENVTLTIEGRARYPVNVRYARDFRDDPSALGRVLVQTPSGARVPLGQLAAIALTTGPSMIRDENGRLASYVYVDSASPALGDYVIAAREMVERQLTLPTGYSLEWTGQYEFQARAARRLAVVVPIVLTAIFLLLFVTFHSVSEALTVMCSVVFAMTGGVLLQWLLGYNFSVASAVGYIALYGVAVQTGVVMVVYLHEALDRRTPGGKLLAERDIYEATVEGSVLRLRPKLMTVAATVMGLLPVLWSTGIGADIMKPIAAPIVGGMVTSTLHVLIITPVIFFLMKRRALQKAGRVPFSGN